MATINAVNTSLSGQTGTGSFVGSTSATLVTPALGVPASGDITNCTGAPTLTSVTFNPTTGGIVGTTTNNSASAGYVGEYMVSTVASGSAVSLTSGSSTVVTSLSLTAGDWDVSGNVGFLQTSAVCTFVAVQCSTSSTVGDISVYASSTGSGTTVGNDTSLVAPSYRINLSTPTTINLLALCSFTGAGAAMSGCGRLSARRRR